MEKQGGKKIKKWLIGGLIVVLSLTVVASGGAYWMVRHSVAETSGDIESGVEHKVRISRDEYGVPHIYAENEHDLYYAQGYVQAQDRMWQMEMARRVASGRLAEVIGEEMIPTDKFYRTLGFKRMAQESLKQLDAETLLALQAFTDGVNDFLDEQPEPIENKILPFKQTPWTLSDSLLVSKYMAWELGSNMYTELFMSAATDKIGADRANSLVIDYAKDLPTILKPAASAAEPLPTAGVSPSQLGELYNAMAAGRQRGIPGESLGSNNWVISGKKSASGRPLLANDMHLSLQAPSVFYQTHLVIPSKLNVTGVSFPGAPGVIVGHNDRIAWGFTNVDPDVQDLYIEKRHPDNPRLFEYNGQYEEAKVYREEIKVKGREEPEMLDVTVTRHGPIISGVLEQPIDTPLALRWTAFDFHQELTAMLRFNRAQNWEQFQQAMSLFSAPAQNVVYADVDGNIAYKTVGKIPIRKKGDGLRPVPGWTDEYEWSSYIEWEKLPSALNPEAGYIASANNKVVDDSYPYLISNQWGAPYRAMRIDEMIQEKSTLTLDDMQRMQRDYHNLQAKKNVPAWLPILEQGTWNEQEQRALTELKKWAEQPVDDPDQIGATIYHSVLSHSLEEMFKPQLGEELFKSFIQSGLSVNALDAVFQGAMPGWFEGSTQTREQGLQKAFHAAVAFLTEKIGEDMSAWRWGDIHTMTFAHTLGSAKPLDLLFNDGPYPMGGSHVTVAAAAYSRTTRPYEIYWGAPWRFVIDMNDPAAARDVLGMGNSGQLGSDHYNDQTPLWLEGRYKSMHFSEEAVKQAQQQEMILLPR